MIDRTGEVWHHDYDRDTRGLVLIVRSYVPEGYPERLLRHEAVQLDDGWRFGIEELVLRHRGWNRVL